MEQLQDNQLSAHALLPLQLRKPRLSSGFCFAERLNHELETDMKKMKFMCVTLMLLGSVPAGPAWANRGAHHGHHGHHNHGHHHNGGGWGFGGYGAALGIGLLGYGLGSYFGSRPSYGYPAGAYAPGYGYAPAYGYAPVVAAPVVPPPVYIQRQEVVPAQAQPQASNYWHYCRNPEGYYPYVKSCPDGWLQVVPQ
jgi:hypothetical protein